MGIAYLNAARVLPLALRNAFITAALEIAAVGKINRAGHLSGYRIQRLVYVRIDHRLAFL